MSLDDDPLTQQATEQSAEARHDRVEVDDLGLRGLPAAEHEQLPDECRGSVGGQPQIVDQFGGSSFRRSAVCEGDRRCRE